MPNSIEVRDVVKTFKGLRAVDGVSFDVDEGSFTALLGPNGSGKSTLLKMCTNMYRPDSGTIAVNGRDVNAGTADALSGAGCVIETPGVYPDATGRRYLKYIGMLMGMSSGEAGSEASRVLDMLGMTDSADRRMKGYSKGMRQRMVLGQALMGSPSLLILDEPTSGLDPGGSEELMQMLVGLNRAGTTILMSSHMLHEVEGVCDRVVMINHGKVVVQSAMAELTSRSWITVMLSSAPSDSQLSALEGMPGVQGVESHGVEIRVKFAGDNSQQADLVRSMVDDGLRVYSVGRNDPLKEVFMDCTEGEVE